MIVGRLAATNGASQAANRPMIMEGEVDGSWSLTMGAQLAVRGAGRLRRWAMSGVASPQRQVGGASATVKDSATVKMAGSSWQSGQSPQNVTSASSITKPLVAALGSRQGAEPTTQSTSPTLPQPRQTTW